MKTLIFVGLLVGFVVYVFDGPSTPVHAKTVEQASATLAKTERDLRTTATTTGVDAAVIQHELSAPDRATALPKELQDFNLSTQRLITLRADLDKDVNEYKAAYAEKLATFDQERAAIADPATQRSMDTLRRHTEQDMNERVMTAKATLEQLDTVLAKGADLQHAAKCILVAEELQNHGNDVDAQLKTARQQAADYSKVTNGLLARINTALAE